VALAEFPENRTPKQTKLVEDYHAKQQQNGEWEVVTAHDSSTPANVPVEDSDFRALSEQMSAVEATEESPPAEQSRG
jgi:hypothetical protein